ncbi:ethanolamine utilization protein EutJ [Anaerolinea sp.]|uniref:ethanolamine utilization protein EutJ n=1 Tax=Anaerolinea sp. TaxID=1872519 RepID=UPI002ACD7A0B|nr:ethanolamine utilization protein EutJ [Anaerolinea sp.]
MNTNLHSFLQEAEKAIQRRSINGYRGQVHCGVDLGTAYVSMFVLTEDYQPLVGTYQFAEIVRDGLVVDFAGAVDLVRKMKADLESRLGFELTSAATAYPPGVPIAEVRATRYVLEAAGLNCSNLVDEPTAANAVLEVKDGAVVDIGGGTTGIAIIQNGEVIYTADEPTGGTHFTLVVAGALKISFHEAEEKKIDPSQQPVLYPLVRPVMEKVGSIIQRHIQPYAVDCIYLVGGSSAFIGFPKVIEGITGIKTVVPGNPLFVTPLGIAMNDRISS